MNLHLWDRNQNILFFFFMKWNISYHLLLIESLKLTNINWLSFTVSHSLPIHSKLHRWWGQISKRGPHSIFAIAKYRNICFSKSQYKINSFYVMDQSLLCRSAFYCSGKEVWWSFWTCGTSIYQPWKWHSFDSFLILLFTLASIYTLIQWEEWR